MRKERKFLLKKFQNPLKPKISNRITYILRRASLLSNFSIYLTVFFDISIASRGIYVERKKLLNRVNLFVEELELIQKNTLANLKCFVAWLLMVANASYTELSSVMNGSLRASASS